MPRLCSLNVGLPRESIWNSRTVRTAIWMLPVEGRRMVRKLNIDGDAQLSRTTFSIFRSTYTGSTMR